MTIHHSGIQSGQERVASAKERRGKVEVEDAGEIGGPKRECRRCGGRREVGHAAGSSWTQTSNDHWRRKLRSSMEEPDLVSV